MEQPIDILIEGIKQFIANYEYLKEKSKYLYEENQELLKKMDEIRAFLREVKSVKHNYSCDTYKPTTFEYKKKRIEF